MVKRASRVLVLSTIGFTAVPSLALATPSTTYWAPSTASCQARGVPHVTYDTYFGKGPAAGSQGAPNYPIDTGLTVGFLPFEKLQGEVGFDLLLPRQDPFLLNAKLCIYFADNVSLLIGPVFYFDRNLQPGGKKTLWTAQLDVDIPLGRK